MVSKGEFIMGNYIDTNNWVDIKKTNLYPPLNETVIVARGSSKTVFWACRRKFSDGIHWTNDVWQYTPIPGEEGITHWRRFPEFDIDKE
jgi:hypothetical protein